MAAVDSLQLFWELASKDIKFYKLAVTNTLLIVGAWYTFRLTIKFGQVVFDLTKCCKRFLSRKNFVRNYGSWAVVTGCTSGIGKAFVHVLASHGMNIIMISRDESKLKTESSLVESMYGVHVVTVVHNFASGPEDLQIATRSIKDLDIGILVNNVGIHQEYPQLFSEVKYEHARDMVEINMKSVVLMTHIVLPGMISKKKGLIVNLSSTAGLIPTPYISLYSATKTFVDYFSRALSHEVADKNIHVQSLVPMYVQTGMTSYFPPILRSFQLFMPTPETYANHAVSTFGQCTSNTGYFPHTIQRGLMQISPNFLTLWFGKLMHNYLAKRVEASLKKSD